MYSEPADSNMHIYCKENTIYIAAFECLLICPISSSVLLAKPSQEDKAQHQTELQFASQAYPKPRCCRRSSGLPRIRRKKKRIRHPHLTLHVSKLQNSEYLGIPFPIASNLFF